MTRPWRILSESSEIEKKDVVIFLGVLFIESTSMGSFANTIEQVGPMINSRKMT
jgi:hypothetical protein